MDYESDHPTVILATLPTFPKNQTTRALFRLGREPAPPGVHGKGKPQTRGVRANAAVTLMLLANLMRWSTPPTRWILRGVAIGWKGSRRKS